MQHEHRHKGRPACGYARLNRANTMASAIAPPAVKTHAMTLLSPKGASEAGKRNTPEPIELPTTSATHIQNPRSGRLEFMGDTL